MKILFVHQNFPGQFKSLAPELAKDPANEVLALTLRQTVPANWNGVRVVSYSLDSVPRPSALSWLSDFEVKSVRAEACFKAASQLASSGFTPDIILAHPAWGESLYLKEVWPKAKLLIYCEFFYRASGLDVGFDPEQNSIDPSDIHRFRLKNINNLLHLEIADGGISPTHWQASTFPSEFQKKITVIHDGIDTQLVRPNPNASIALNTSRVLSRQDQIITFVSRDLEPYRGFHIFMRMLPELLRRHPQAMVLIVGGAGTNYGAKPPEGKTWVEIFASEVRGQIPEKDWQRVHFLGKIPYSHYLSILQISSAHLYLTYPFVLSWSLLEAMSCACTIAGSDTPPVQEVLHDQVTGRLVPFFDLREWTNTVSELLVLPPDLRANMTSQARSFAVENYDLKTVTLPKQLRWIQSFLE